MTSYNMPDITNVLIAVTAWLTGLALIAWMGVGTLDSLLELGAPVFLTAGAAGAAALLFSGMEETSAVTEDVRSRLVLKDVPASRR
jgi:hypothetical protein